MNRYLIPMIILLSSRASLAQNSLKVKGDSVSITDVELVVRNASRNVSGFLYNTDNGKTTFRKIGKAIQFSVGANGFPIAGDSVFTSPDFINRNIKVWRNGMLQNGGNVRIDALPGKIIFTPVLIPNEKIYIEIFNNSDFSVIF